MTNSTVLVAVTILLALCFDFFNGFHDAANAIATVVSTKVLTPRQAIGMAAVFNLTGALLGGAVASTIGKGLVDTNVVTLATVLCALISAFAWNIITWWVGLPSSSSHALIGGLCGAALAAEYGLGFYRARALVSLSLAAGKAGSRWLAPASDAIEERFAGRCAG